MTVIGVEFNALVLNIEIQIPIFAVNYDVMSLNAVIDDYILFEEITDSVFMSNKLFAEVIRNNRTKGLKQNSCQLM